MDLHQFPLDAFYNPVCPDCGQTGCGDTAATLGDLADWALGHHCAGGAA